MEVGKYVKLKREWDQLTPDQQAKQAGGRKFKAFLESRGDFDEIEKRAERMVAAVREIGGLGGFGEAINKLAKTIYVQRPALLDDPEWKAYSALMSHLTAALNDEEIKASAQIHNAVKEACHALGRIRARKIKPDAIANALARPARSERAKKMTANATKVNADTSTKIQAALADVLKKNPKLSQSAAQGIVAKQFNVNRTTISRNLKKPVQP